MVVEVRGGNLQGLEQETLCGSEVLMVLVDLGNDRKVLRPGKTSKGRPSQQWCSPQRLGKQKKPLEPARGAFPGIC